MRRSSGVDPRTDCVEAGMSLGIDHGSPSILTSRRGTNVQLIVEHANIVSTPSARRMG